MTSIEIARRDGDTAAAGPRATLMGKTILRKLMLLGAAALAAFASIGEAVAEVIKRTQRCAATNVNPETASRDMNLPRALQKGWGHTDLGVYARVITPGEIRPGDIITLMD